MDSKLSKVFDFAKFSKNEKIEKMVEDINESLGEKLTLDDLDEVAAARGDIAGARTDTVSFDKSPYGIGNKAANKLPKGSGLC